MKKFFAFILLMVIIILSFTGCVQHSQNDITSYKIDAELRDYSLHIKEDICYINNEDKPLSTLRLVSYVGAYTLSGNIANNSSSMAYPFGVNYANLNIENIIINGHRAEYKVIDPMYIDVYFDRVLKQGKSVDISIEYSESIPKNRLRYGYNSTSINLGNAFIRVTPLYNGEYISYPFSLNGDPFYNDVADFDISLKCNRKYKVVGSSRLASRIDGENAVYIGKISKVRDYALVLSDVMSVINDESDSIKVSYMTIKPQNASKISLVKCVLTTFSQLFMEYPYDNIVVVENDFVEGGMEYPGIIYVNSALDEVNLEKVIIHELAHQWWYGIVGVNENIDYFIDEGMAELSTYLYYKHNGEEQYAKALIKMMYNAYMMTLSNGVDISSVRIELDKLNDMEYYTMAYLKSPLILYAMLTEMGEERFIETTRKIISKYRFQNIDVDTFIKEFGTSKERLNNLVYGKADLNKISI